MRRLATWLLLLLTGAAVVLVLLWAGTPRAVEGQLRAQGFTWQARDGLTWSGLQRTGIHIDTLSLQLTPSPGAAASGIAVQLDQLAVGQSPAGDSEAGAVPLPDWLPGRLRAADVTVLWNQHTIAEGLSGELWPDLDLGGPSSLLQRGPDGWSAALRHPVSLDALSGDALLTIDGHETLALHLEMPRAVIQHALLAPQPLPASALEADLRWRRADGTLTGTVSLGGATINVSGTLSAEPLRLDADLTADAIPLSAVTALFGRLVPEADHAEISGSIGLDAQASGPPLVWQAQLSADRLAASGAVRNMEALKYGVFSWRAPAQGGGVLARETGDGHRTWTPLRDGQLMGQAAIASEDARFFEHPGYDIEGINVALAEVASGAERPRGGSTITQQLSKNLFLSGERTIARKLRELLYTLDMEQNLSKQRILELYINVVEFGPTIYGVRSASNAYFLKRPEGLGPHEAAFLAAILPSPRKWYARIAQGRSPPGGKVDRILSNMANTGAIEWKTARWAQQEPLIVIPPLP